MRMLAAIIALLFLGACGQTGPLYLPGEEPPVRSSSGGAATGADEAGVEQQEPAGTQADSAG